MAILTPQVYISNYKVDPDNPAAQARNKALTDAFMNGIQQAHERAQLEKQAENQQKLEKLKELLGVKQANELINVAEAHAKPGKTVHVGEAGVTISNPGELQALKERNAQDKLDKKIDSKRVGDISKEQDKFETDTNKATRGISLLQQALITGNKQSFITAVGSITAAAEGGRAHQTTLKPMLGDNGLTGLVKQVNSMSDDQAMPFLQNQYKSYAQEISNVLGIVKANALRHVEHKKAEIADYAAQSNHPEIYKFHQENYGKPIVDAISELDAAQTRVNAPEVQKQRSQPASSWINRAVQSSLLRGGVAPILEPKKPTSIAQPSMLNQLSPTPVATKPGLESLIVKDPNKLSDTELLQEINRLKMGK